jgi:hypothetical protein
MNPLMRLRPAFFFEGGLWRMEDGGEGDRDMVWGVSATLASFDSFES